MGTEKQKIEESTFKKRIESQTFDSGNRKEIFDTDNIISIYEAKRLIVQNAAVLESKRGLSGQVESVTVRRVLDNSIIFYSEDERDIVNLIS